MQAATADPATAQRLWHRLARVYLSRAERLYGYAALAQQQRQPGEAQRLWVRARGFDQRAIATLGQAPTSTDSLEQLQGQLLSVLPSQRLGGLHADGLQAIEEMVQQLDPLPATHSTLLARLQLATLWIKLQGRPAGYDLTRRFSPQTDCLAGVDLTRPQAIVAQTQKLAQIQGNHAALAQAWGLLGHFAECRQHWSLARTYTEKALGLSDDYLWDWQLARIYRAQGQRQAATIAYGRAIDTLKRMRADVAIANRDFQLDIRDSVSELYRQLAALQLSLERPEVTPVATETLDQVFRQALKTLDELKLVELLTSQSAPNIMILSANIKPVVRLKGLINSYAGGVTMIDKGQSLNEMLMLADLALRGSICWPQQIRGWLNKEAFRKEFDESWLAVLKLRMDEGLNDKGIAKRLHVTERTVRNYWVRLRDNLCLAHEPEKDFHMQIYLAAKELGLVD